MWRRNEPELVRLKERRGMELQAEADEPSMKSPETVKRQHFLCLLLCTLSSCHKPQVTRSCSAPPAFLSFLFHQNKKRRWQFSLNQLHRELGAVAGVARPRPRDSWLTVKTLHSPHAQTVVGILRQRARLTQRDNKDNFLGCSNYGNRVWSCSKGLQLDRTWFVLGRVCVCVESSASGGVDEEGASRAIHQGWRGNLGWTQQDWRILLEALQWRATPSKLGAIQLDWSASGDALIGWGWGHMSRSWSKSLAD